MTQVHPDGPRTGVYPAMAMPDAHHQNPMTLRIALGCLLSDGQSEGGLWQSGGWVRSQGTWAWVKSSPSL